MEQNVELRPVTLDDPSPASNEERSRILRGAGSLVLHLHPASVPARSLRFAYTWGLGGMSTVLVIILVLTGLLMMFRYDARTEYAYISIQQMETEVIFGSLIRAAHHWSANLLVITSFLHLLRVFLTGSYKQGRGFNWLIGLIVFVLALAANFSGYLLPWDQLAYWAITVSTSLVAYIPLIGTGLRNFALGGPQVGQAALSNFYALHVVFIPVLLAILMSYHFWKVRKNGGITHPPSKDGHRVERLSTIPHLVNVELAAGLVMIVLVTVWAMSMPAPLGQIANPVSSPNPAKAAWYFVGLQELLLHMHPLAAMGLLGIVAAGVVMLPLIDRKEQDVGVYFRSSAGRRAALLGTLLGVNLTPLLVVLDEYWIDLPAWLPGLHPNITTGFIPFAVTLLFFFLLYAAFRLGLLDRGHRTTHSEALVGVFAFAVAGLLMMTLIGNIFRGANMSLYLPF